VIPNSNTEWLDPPKFFRWIPQLSPQYTTNCDVLITGGCSFTASTNQTESAASWPGFVKDRCGLDLCIDTSYPGYGNFAIRDNVFQAVEQSEYKNPLVVVMWSGLDRNPEMGTPEQSIQAILDLKKYLKGKKIQHVFTTYLNMFYPPFVPVRDSTPRYADYDIDKELFVPNTGKEFLYEWALKQDQLSEDLYHPTREATESWTDQILLTYMQKQNIIQSLEGRKTL